MQITEPDFSVSLRRLLATMVKKDASDLYISAGLPPAYRINDVVYPLKEPALNAIQCEQLAYACMSEKQKAKFASELEINLSLHLPDLGRFRVNVYRQKGTVSMVVRQIKTKVPTIDELGLPEVFKELVMTKRGLIIMVGGTGSGKSTSLAAMIDWRNANQTGHIITIEDPVEFIHSHKKSVISQREVGTDTLSFENALKNALRQSPDVILIGEIRDSETMENAMIFAETGHLAMATLHANNANQAIERILNFFSEEKHPQVYMNLALNLRAILSQRLVRRVDGGRVAAIEILINTPRIADLILKGKIEEIKDAMASGSQYGMQTFDQHLFKLWTEGIISEIEALRNADAPNDLRLKMKMSKLGGREGQEIDSLLGSEREGGEEPELKI